MSLSQIEYLKHILDEIDYLLKHSKGLSLDEFVKDETLQRAFVRSLEILGEATKKISSEVKAKYPDVKWKVIADRRNKLIPDYFSMGYRYRKNSYP